MTDMILRSALICLVIAHFISSSGKITVINII